MVRPHRRKRQGMKTSTKLIVAASFICALYLFYFQSHLSNAGAFSLVGENDLIETKRDTVRYSGDQQIIDLSSHSAPNDVHVIFSTDCSPFQSWQSFAVFHSAFSVSQPGLVTRIVSGCTPSEHELMQTWHDTYITPMSPSFRVHFTPAYDHVEGESTKYAFFNKPYGTLHFLENGIGIGADGEIKVRWRWEGVGVGLSEATKLQFIVITTLSLRYHYVIITLSLRALTQSLIQSFGRCFAIPSAETQHTIRPHRS